MSDQTPTKPLRDIAAGTRYPVEAFQFVRRGLEFTVQRNHENPELLNDAERHVDGRQLSEGLRDFAIEQYGRMAGAMMRRWHIRRTEDFGRIVFAMVEAGLMQATEGDSMRDFEDGFDFEVAFDVAVPVDQVAIEEYSPDAVEHGGTYA
jgi:uncharacterized repeat protein (TIGR04138 family)